jgi:gliding motility-associated-like protein
LFDNLDGGSYRIEVENTLTGCKSQPSVFYTINAAPLPSVPPFVGVAEEYCVRDLASPVRALGQPQGQLVWYTNASGGAGSSAAPIPSTVSAGTTVYYVTQRLPGFCESPRVPLTVIVHPLPLVNAGGDKEIVRGQRTTLDGTASGTGISVLWTPGFGLSDAKITTPVASPEQTTVYTLTVTSDEGCKSTDNMRIIVKEPRVVKIPNVISPNGDGVHDRWVIGNIEDYPDAEVQIFNRYGAQVYEVKGYNNANGWDGKLNGADLPVGAYYYIIRLNGKLKPIAGNLSIIR